MKNNLWFIFLRTMLKFIDIYYQSFFAKLFGKLTSLQLSVDCKNIIIDHQHSFMPGQFTDTNLLIY